MENQDFPGVMPYCGHVCRVVWDQRDQRDEHESAGLDIPLCLLPLLVTLSECERYDCEGSLVAMLDSAVSHPAYISAEQVQD